jgi:hypothetical protein
MLGRPGDGDQDNGNSAAVHRAKLAICNVGPKGAVPSTAKRDQKLTDSKLRYEHNAQGITRIRCFCSRQGISTLNDLDLGFAMQCIFTHKQHSYSRPAQVKGMGDKHGLHAQLVVHSLCMAVCWPIPWL